MPSAAAVRGILRTDGLRLVRDRFLMGLVVYILAVSVAMRWAIPWMTTEAEARWAFDLTPWYPLLVSHIVVGLAGLLAGFVGGFMLLEGREEGTIRAMTVSPVPLAGYLSVLSLTLILASIALTLVEGALIGVGLPPWPALAAAAIAGAPAAPGLALCIGAFADDKVQAFAYAKLFGAAPLIPTLMYFVAEPWQWLAAVYPPYWATKAYWVAEAGGTSWPLWALGGLALSTLWLAFLGRLFLKAART